MLYWVLFSNRVRTSGVAIKRARRAVPAGPSL